MHRWEIDVRTWTTRIAGTRNAEVRSVPGRCLVYRLSALPHWRFLASLVRSGCAFALPLVLIVTTYVAAAPASAASTAVVNRHIGAVSPRPSEPAERARWAVAAKKQCRAKPITPLKNVKQARASSWRWLEKREGKRDVDKLRKSLTKAKRAKVERLSRQALLAGRPGAALVAQLVLSQRYPSDTAVLLNVASLLTTLGRHREAYPFLIAATKRPVRSTVAGVPGIAVETNIKGWVLLGLGRAAAASKAFNASWKASKALSETASGAAMAALCTKSSKAAKMWRVRAESRGEKLPRPIEPTIDTPIVTPDLLAKVPPTGHPLSSWSVALPASIGDSKRYLDRLKVLNEESYARWMTEQRTARAMSDRWSASERDWLAPQKKRYRVALYSIFSPTGVESLPAMAELVRAEWTAYRAMDRVEESWGRARESGSMNCSLAVPEFQKLMDAAFIYLEVSRAKQRLAYEQRLKIARLLDNPIGRENLRQEALAEAEESRWFTIGQVMGPLWSASRMQHCGVSTGANWAGKAESIAPFTRAAGLGCPSFLKFGVKLDIVSIAVSCERVTLGLATPGTIGGFVQGDIAWHGKSMTLFAGGQLKVGAGDISATAKAGAYVVLGSDQVEDVGIRADVSGKWTSGSWQVGVSGPGVSKSFMVPAGTLQPFDYR